MIGVFRDSWALLLGLMLLMLGNGLQGTLLGVRGAMEGMTPTTLSFVMSAYFVGILIGSRLTPRMIRNVGHVRVFAALASLISAGFLLYAAFPDPWVWAGVRLIVGFSFCGVYVVSESWLNDRATNETRGQAMSAYMLVQMVGIVAAQGLLTLADPAGFALFALISALVSVAVAPMLLHAAPAPFFRTAGRMTLRRLYAASPLGCVGVFILGGVVSAMFGMGAVYGAQAGLTITQISTFVGAIYLGGLLAQWPIGWLSDRMDRRKLIVGCCAVAALAGLFGALTSGFWPSLAAAALVGAMGNPLYGLLIAHTNDFLDPEEMAAASGGMLFLNGVGAVSGPLVVGALMDFAGPGAYFAYFAGLFVAIAGYGAWRMTRRPAPAAATTGPHASVLPSASPVAVEIVTEIAAESAQTDEHAEARKDASVPPAAAAS